MKDILIDKKIVEHKLIDMGKNDTDLAKAIKVDGSMISRVLKGERMVNVKRLFAMADYLGTTADELVIKIPEREGA